MAQFLTLPLEIRYRIFDLLTPPSRDITTGTTAVDSELYEAAAKLTQDELDNLPATEFFKAEVILARASNTLSSAVLRSLPDHHRLATRVGFDPSLLEIFASLGSRARMHRRRLHVGPMCDPQNATAESRPSA
jgi:diadenosine tetraphosphatase ApaH/serine/threonine PP2A family protein phosphatase